MKMAARHLRSTYRDLLLVEIARTVADPDEIDAEIQTLLTSLRT
ncbi:MAG TPA: hypothetical protein VGP68_04025 [Gemmataceae bacterium]|nr:hypothetical protein [Gemmataceae bacterium]